MQRVDWGSYMDMFAVVGMCAVCQHHTRQQGWRYRERAREISVDWYCLAVLHICAAGILHNRLRFVQ